jgi:hypothetical protein
VVSHDCDVVNPSLTTERQVELALAEWKGKREPEGNYAFGRNSRALEFAHGGATYQIQADNRWRVDRSVLARSGPDGALDGEAIRVLAGWLASRYNRTALPDAFNERVLPAVVVVRKELKKNPPLASLFVSLDTEEELAEGRSYHVTVIASMLVGDHGDIATVQKALLRIEAVLAGCAGIEVETVDFLPEDAITLYDMRRLRVWDFNYISYRAGTPGAISPTA